MRKSSLLTALLLFGVMLLPAGAAGTDPDYPAAAGYFNDLTGTLPEAVQQALELRLRAYERATSNEVAVAVVPSLQGQSVEDYAKGLFRSWKIGQAGLNNGVLFLWAPSERKLRIEVGYGLENSLTEAQAARILSQATPLFKQSDYSGGVRLVVDSIIQQLGEEQPKPPAAPAGGRGPFEATSTWLIAGFVVFAITLGIMHYHTSRVHYLQEEVPIAISRARLSLQEAEAMRVQADADLEQLRAEAPPEVWEAHAFAMAGPAEILDTLRRELDRVQSERKEEFREWNSAHKSLRRWNHTLEQQTARFSAVSTTLKQFRESRDAAAERIAALPALLSQLDDQLTEDADNERNRQLLQAARESFERARELRSNPPVNWLLACDLLNDAHACLQCIGILNDPEADEQQKRASLQACLQMRYWAESGTQSPAGDQMAGLMTQWNSPPAVSDASAAGSASGGSFDGGATFGGGDTGGSGASAGY